MITADPSAAAKKLPIIWAGHSSGEEVLCAARPLFTPELKDDEERGDGRGHRHHREEHGYELIGEGEPLNAWEHQLVKIAYLDKGLDFSKD